MTHKIGAALVENFAAVVGTLIGTEVQVTRSFAGTGAQWHAEVTVEGPARGSFILAIDTSSAAEIAALVTGLDEIPTQTVIDTFREVCNQVLDSGSVKAAAGGATLKLAGIAGVGEQEPATGWEVYAMTAARLEAPITVAIWSDVQFRDAAETQKQQPRAAAKSVAAAPPARPVERELPPSADRMHVILDMDLPLTARFGRTELPLKTLTRIGPGSVIDLGRSAEDPVEVLVSNRVVARGEVVIVSGNYAIRIIDVISPQDRTGFLEE